MYPWDDYYEGRMHMSILEVHTIVVDIFQVDNGVITAFKYDNRVFRSVRPHASVYPAFTEEELLPPGHKIIETEKPISDHDKKKKEETKTKNPLFITEKHCPKCDTTKPRTDFNLSKKDRTGLQSYCRECSNKNRTTVLKTKPGKKHKKAEQTTALPEQKQVIPEQIPQKTEQKKGFTWTPERDQKLIEAFHADLGISGIYDAGILPGFSLTEIRDRCQELKLIDAFGITITERGGGTKR